MYMVSFGSTSDFPCSVYHFAHRANGSWFVCLFIYQETKGSYLYANGLNGLITDLPIYAIDVLV